MIELLAGKAPQPRRRRAQKRASASRPRGCQTVRQLVVCNAYQSTIRHAGAPSLPNSESDSLPAYARARRNRVAVRRPSTRSIRCRDWAAPADGRRHRGGRRDRLCARRQRCRHAGACRPCWRALATIGLFFLFAYSAGYIRFGQRAPLGRCREGGHRRARHRRDDRDAATASRSTPTPPSRRSSGARDADRLGALQELFTGEPQASAALFRLTRAAERGETLAEEFALAPVAPAERDARARCSSRCIPSSPSAEGASAGLVLWRIADVTAERQQEADAHRRRRGAARAVRCRARSGSPRSAADGTLLHVNGTLARWIGRTPKSVLEQRLTLADIASGDGAGPRLRASPAAPTSRSASLDVDLVREDGRILPARLLARAVPSGKGLTLAVVNLAGEGAGRVREPTRRARALPASSSRRRSASPFSAPTGASPAPTPPSAA